MRVYEVLFIVAPNTEESDTESLITQMSDVITNQGATVTKVDRIGRRRLAYPIGKFNEGYYVVLTVEGTGTEIAEVERRMRVDGCGHSLHHHSHRRRLETRRKVSRSSPGACAAGGGREAVGALNPCFR